MSYQTTIRPSTASLSNNQVVAANVPGLFIDPTKHPIYQLSYSIIRRYSTPNSEVVETGTITGRFDKPYPTLWTLSKTNVIGSSGIVLTQLGSGQFQYTSTNISGTVLENTIRWSINLL